MMIVAVTENSGGCSWKITVICIELEGCKAEEDWKVSPVSVYPQLFAHISDSRWCRDEFNVRQLEFNVLKQNSHVMSRRTEGQSRKKHECRKQERGPGWREKSVSLAYTCNS